MSDGGDGFGSAMGALLGARPMNARTVDAAGRPCTSHWWWHPETKTAVVESAAAIGLAMLPPGRFHPFELDTYGLGAVLTAAARKGAQNCLIGIGGSATNDGGFGVARALGWRFLDGTGTEIRQWTALRGLERLEAPRVRPRFRKLLVAVDVTNPLLGPRGASRVYGPQKGLRRADFPLAEACLRRLTTVVKRALERDLARAPGAGAAGGLGFGLAAFLGARLTPGFQLWARWAGLQRELARSDCVITGEGAVDESTLMGKGVSELARLCRGRRLPCIALSGSVALPARKLKLFSAALGLTDITSLKDAKAQPACWLENLAELVARWFRP